MLEGIRVLELGHAVAGPAAGLILSDLGAEVIKVEKPDRGDHFRDLPGMGVSIFVALNRGKKSLALDLSKPEGLDLFLRLVRISDVVIDNLDPEASRKLGITYERLAGLNPSIIYCKITGFGEGPYGGLPAYDPMLQAISGIMSVTGVPPDVYVRSGISLVDVTGAFNCVIGVLLALYKRVLTGRGAYIEVSLFDSAVFHMGYWISYFDLYGRVPEPLGSGHIFAAPYGLFRVADGLIYLAIASDTHWRRFCEALGFKDLLDDPRYKSNQDRVKNKRDLEAEVEARLRGYRLEELFRILRENGIPGAPFYTVDKLLKDPHLMARSIIGLVPWGERSVRTSLNPLVINGVRYSRATKAPSLGEHTELILKEFLGLSDIDVQVLREKNIIK